MTQKNKFHYLDTVKMFEMRVICIDYNEKGILYSIQYSVKTQKNCVNTRTDTSILI